MYKISGAKLLAFDFRDYALLTKAFLTDNLLMKGTKFTDVLDLSGSHTDFGLDVITDEQWYNYVEETDIYDISVKKDAKGAGGTLRDVISGEELHLKKLGKIPTSYKKLVLFEESDMTITPAGPKVKTKSKSGTGSGSGTESIVEFTLHPSKIYLSSSKITSANISIGDDKDVNFCVNKTISDSHFAKEKYDKVANVVKAKVKPNNSKVVFKLGEKTPSKFLTVDHKKHGILAAFYLRDPVKNKQFLLSFGGEKPESNVSSHEHITIEKMTKDTVGFLAHVFKNMLFISSKKIEKGSKGPEKLAALFPHLKSIAGELVKNSGFVVIASETVA